MGARLHTVLGALLARCAPRMALLATTLALAACSSTVPAPVATAGPPVRATAHAAPGPSTTAYRNISKRCTDLTDQTLPASVIGLPTRGAPISTATFINATLPGNIDGEYCRITGAIQPLDQSAPDIRFQVNLPTRWNGRALQMGGGGYSGEVVRGTGVFRFSPGAPPLTQGYVTFGDDSGHIGNAANATFASNDEAVLNFGYAHLKKTHDVALALIRQIYGKPPDKTYFIGGSTGGREGYTVIERFPDDYDGVVAEAPAINFSGVRLIGISVGQAAYRKPGGFVPRVKQRLVQARAMATCDALDGATDGIISDVEACRALEPQIIASLRCADGTDRGDTCLSDAQLATLETLRDGLTLPYALANDVHGYSGYNVFEGADLSGMLGLGESATLQTPPTFEANGYLFAQGDAYLKYFVTRDPAFASLNFDAANPGRYQQRLVELSATVGAMNPDWSAFIAHGGKIITLHGLADGVISPNQTIAFYRGLVARYGQARVDTFMRFYTVPGFQHGSGVFRPSWDALDALDRWVTLGRAPEQLSAVDIATATNGRARPLCRYPTFPRYLGKGNVNQATSFVCASH